MEAYVGRGVWGISGIISRKKTDEGYMGKPVYLAKQPANIGYKQVFIY